MGWGKDPHFALSAHPVVMSQCFIVVVGVVIWRDFEKCCFSKKVAIMDFEFLHLPIAPSSTPLLHRWQYESLRHSFSFRLEIVCSSQSVCGAFTNVVGKNRAILSPSLLS